MRNKISGKRVLLYLLGMNIMSVGILLSTRTHLGVAAISSVAYSYSTFWHISFGTANFILYILFITAQAILLKAFSYRLLLQIPMAFFSRAVYRYIRPADPFCQSGFCMWIFLVDFVQCTDGNRSLWNDEGKSDSGPGECHRGYVMQCAA